MNEAYRSLIHNLLAPPGQIKSLVFPTHVLWALYLEVHVQVREAKWHHPGVSPTATIRKAISALQKPPSHTSPEGIPVYKNEAEAHMVKKWVG